MPISLEELRAQRDNLKQHLSWLEEKIAEFEGSEAAAEAEKEEAVPEVIEKPVLPMETAPPPLKEADLAKQPGGDIAQSTKTGCIVMIVIACAIILFLLFGLPQLLYSE